MIEDIPFGGEITSGTLDGNFNANNLKTFTSQSNELHGFNPTRSLGSLRIPAEHFVLSGTGSGTLGHVSYSGENNAIVMTTPSIEVPATDEFYYDFNWLLGNHVSNIDTEGDIASDISVLQQITLRWQTSSSGSLYAYDGTADVSIIANDSGADQDNLAEIRITKINDSTLFVEGRSLPTTVSDPIVDWSNYVDISSLSGTIGIYGKNSDGGNAAEDIYHWYANKAISMTYESSNDNGSTWVAAGANYKKFPASSGTQFKFRVSGTPPSSTRVILSDFAYKPYY